MSDLLALHWAHDHVTVFSPGKGDGGRAVVLEHKPTTDADAIGKWLKAGLAANRISGKRAAIVLPRSAAILRKLALPQVPDEELPDLVRMQAATKSSTPLDRLKLDFVPIPQRGEGRETLLATIPAKIGDEVVAAVRAAGLEPISMGLSPFGTAAKIAAGAESCLIVAVSDQIAEITLVRDGAVQFSHVGDLPGDAADEDRQWLASEVSRAVIAADHLASSAAITRVVLLGPAELLEPLVESFAQRYDAACELKSTPESLHVTVAEGAASVAAIAAAAGQLVPGGVARIDLLNPRKRIEKPDRTRLKMILGGAAVAALIFGAYGLSWLEQASLADEIANLQSEQSRIEGTLKAGEPEKKAHTAVKSWIVKEADWTQQLVLLDSILPGTSQIYLTELSLAPGARDTIGQINGKGFARTESDVRSLQESLASAGYLVKASPTRESLKDPEYPKQFDLDLTIPVPKSAGPAKTAPAT
jgi:Tfp pilus assembly protein PilN